MLIRDSETAGLRKQQDQIRATRQMTADAANVEARAAGLVDRKDRSVANYERQAGRRLTSSEFINKLRKINPNFVLDPHPGISAPKDTAFYRFNYDKAVLSIILPDEKKHFVIVCEGDIMPEWTVMATKEVLAPGRTPAGLWDKVKIPHHREKRGWREVLMFLITRRLITLADSDRVFGSSDRESWKIITGQRWGQQLV